MDTATETPTVAVPQDEASALKTLKSKLDDKTLLIDQGDALQSHMIAFPQSPAQLAKKIDKSRSWVTEVAGFAKLPENLKAQARETRAGYRDLRALQSVVTGGNNEVISVNRQNPGSVGKINSVVPVNKQVNSVNSKSPATSQGHPLLRDTLNCLVSLLRFWSRLPEPSVGEVAERWVIWLQSKGWLRATFSVLYFVLAVYGTWNVGAALSGKRAWLPTWHWGSQLGKGGGPAGGPAATGRPATPQITQKDLIVGNRMRLRWNSVNGAVTYRVYWNDPDGRVEALGEDVTTPGAIASQQSINGHERGTLTVTAIAANQAESIPSDPIEYVLMPVNIEKLGGLTPLPPEGSAPQTAAHNASPGLRPPSPSGRGAGGEALKPPTDVHFQLKTPNVIYVSWRAVGPGVTYNLYSSASSSLTPLRKENRQPLKQNVVTWIPETGLEQYWLVVTALDAQNHESAYSEAIEVVRHPEKTDNSGLVDSAGQVIKKVVPW